MYIADNINNSCIIKKHIFSVGSLICFLVIKDQERLNMPVTTFIKQVNFFNVIIRLFCNNSFNL